MSEWEDEARMVWKEDGGVRQSWSERCGADFPNATISGCHHFVADATIDDVDPGTTRKSPSR